MKKLYLKKVLSMLIHLAICFAVYFIGFSILSLIANFFKHPLIRFGVLFGIPLVIVLIRVYHKRIENNEMRRSYLAEANRERLILKEEWQYMIKFPHFLAEILAFVTIFSPIVIAVGLANPANFFVSIIAGVIILATFGTIYFVLDFALWMIVHNTWRKEA